MSHINIICTTFGQYLKPINTISLETYIQLQLKAIKSCSIAQLARKKLHEIILNEIT